MTSKNSNTTFKILIAILSLMLIALAYYTYTLHNESKNTISGLEKQKAKIEVELEDLIEDYNGLIEESDLKDQSLIKARERIEVLLDSVQKAEANVHLISRYKQEIKLLKNERKILFARADSLTKANQQLAQEIDSTHTILNETIQQVDSINLENIALLETLKKGAVVQAVNLKGDAVIVRKSGKIIDTQRASRADKIRTCFTLAPNSIAEKGDRLLFIQVINPKNNVLGQKSTIEFEEEILTYSTTTKVFYEQEELDVCVKVDAHEDDLIKGRYMIYVFDGTRKVASAELTLK